MKRSDMTGKTFGRLTMLRVVDSDKRGKAKWECRCMCGRVVIARGADIRNGTTTSCGCARAKHGGSGTPEYSVWESMIARCENRKHRAWHDYGGRGIVVCKRWRSNFANFLSDVGPRTTPKHTLDRINNNGDYEPGNVRWATRSEQNANQRPRQDKNWRFAVKHAYSVVRSFEKVLESYTGAPHAVAVDSCTNALLIACAYYKVKEVQLPKFTYIGAAMSVLNAGGRITFRDEKWSGTYDYRPYPIVDAARLFTSKMYRAGKMMCLSFHWTKHLPIGHGGAILCDDDQAANWLRRARFDGRSAGVHPRKDDFDIIGWHVPMAPSNAAQGLLLMAGMEEHNEPLPWGPGTDSDYPDLSKIPLFQ